MLRFLLLTITIATTTIGFSQYTEDDDNSSNSSSNNNSLSDLSFRDRLFTGGNMGFNIVGDILFLDLSPFVGYRVTEKLGAGIGARYTLIRNMTFKQNWSNYGGSIFGRYKIIPQAFLHTEFEILQSYNYDPQSTSYGARAPAFMGFVGAGYATGGSGLNFSILLLYDLIDHINSPYQNSYLLGVGGPPIVLRGGVSIGF